MGLSKWKFSSSRKQSRASTANSETMTTGLPTPTDELSYIKRSNKFSPSSLSASSSSSSRSSPRILWFRLSQRSSSHQASRASRATPKKKSSISRDDPAFARLHKPLTPQNLEHQKLFDGFELTFGTQRRPSSFISSLSPCASRNASLDYGDGYDFAHGLEEDGPYHMLPPNRRQDSRALVSGSIPTGEVAGPESDRE